ncbi:MAG: hypothetical protein ACYDAL_16295 [Candidatus Dormibacteraceae bacterium]
MRNIVLAVLISLAVGAAGFFTGCAVKGAKAPVAGQAANSFESYSYQILSDAQAGLNKTREEISAGLLPQSLVPAFDRAVVLYNQAILLENSYDKILRSGGDVTVTQHEISQDLGSLVELIAQLRPHSNSPAAAPAKH